MYQIKIKMNDKSEKLVIWESGLAYQYEKNPEDVVFHNTHWVVPCSRFRFKKGVMQYIKTHDVAVYTKQPSVNAKEEVHYLFF